jgi:hypothetical protein
MYSRACTHYQNKFPIAVVQLNSYLSNSIMVIFFNDQAPVRIRVRIDPPHPLVCRKRRLNGRTFRTEVPCHSRCGTIKITPCSKALSAEHRPKFCSPSPAMVTSPYKWNILERDTFNNQALLKLPMNYILATLILHLLIIKKKITAIVRLCTELLILCRVWMLLVGTVLRKVSICFFVRLSNFSAIRPVTARAAKLDLCLAFTASSSEGSFTCHSCTSVYTCTNWSSPPTAGFEPVT